MQRLKAKKAAHRAQSEGRAFVRMGEKNVATAEDEPTRGVKLKTVSTFTILFAVACLMAFMAGRPPMATGDGLSERQLYREASTAPSNRFHASKRVYATKRLSDEAFAMNPYIDKAFYVGFRVGSYELGLVKRAGN